MGKKRILLIIIALAVLGLLGGGGFFAYQMFFASPADEIVEEVPPEPQVSMGPVYPLDPFLVNLADPGRPRFLKLVMQVEVDGERVQVELDTIKPKVRDSLLTLLSSKSSPDLVTIADKERLRNEVLHRLNAFLSTGKVVEVYFMDFVVQ
jgi:flagellar FliL protein